jgi:hypothetical protein
VCMTTVNKKRKRRKPNRVQVKRKRME